ncbi:lipase family protein [Cryptosporangium phraense]|uniref:Triacylglycerol lipase n=1 Tax=Cryptosporangium phraense TaxID=2593070 RepID=A0A545AH49_9ACTN|nr:lipase family protein [Cryptosporangium phraense]TQS40005.1 triacylglycerol lipase [Cryptosporangium phraense]
MSKRARLLAALVVVMTVFVGAPADADRGISVPAFYTPPSSLPSENGALIRSEPLPLALSLPGLDGPLPGRATRIMYKSTDNNGRPVAVTGAYLEPTAAWKGPGKRPLVVLAPGTMGQGDHCSTSLALQRGLILGIGVTQSTVSIGYEVLAAYRLLAKGIAVVQTDYVGLGTTDRLHTYVDRVDEGHAVLDAARAARALTGTTSDVGLYGYSQGGGATSSAAELQASYAPDVPLKATYSGAPPADLLDTTTAIDGTELVGAIGWAVNGFVQSDPSLKPLLDKYLSDAGRAALKDLSTMCVGDAIFAYANKKTSSWTTTGQSIADVLRSEPVARAYIDGQRIGTTKPAGIVRVATGVNDNLVPHPQARTMAANWCGLGGDVVYVPVDNVKTPSPLLNHFGPLLSDQGTAVDWLAARLAGTPATSNCGALPGQ